MRTTPVFDIPARVLRRLPLACALAGLLLAAVLSGCAVKPYAPSAPATAARAALSLDAAEQGLSSWQDLRPALERSLAYVAARPQQAAALDRDGLRVTWAQLDSTLTDLLALLPRLDKEPGLLAERFVWLRVAPEPLMTGYYAPYLDASPVRTEEFRYPLYAVPDDLQVLDLGDFHYRWKGQRLVFRMEDGQPVPYYDREAIDFDGALADKGLEIAWVRDQTDVFFLQIQGSGLLRFPDGGTRHVLYAGKNGHKYVSLGRVLADRGLLPLEGMSMRVIREFLAANPDKKQELFSTNPSYVFFRLGDDGPYGAMGKLLTPRVSMATDPGTLPLGSVLAFDTVLPPEAPGLDETRVAGIGLAQDKGGAIKGTRLDYFCGSGPDVEYFAGHIKARTTVHLLLSREAYTR
ncbi:MltA domain-containing protein [Desulfocurvus sp. DL9XJH121]